MTDHYDTLGVSRDADTQAIKRAYRRRSKEVHPDRQGGDARAMVQVNQAYATLSDPEKRAHYDRCGEDRAPPPPIDVQARAMAMGMFMQLLERISDHDHLINLVKQELREMQAKARGGIANGESRVTRLEKIRGRLKYHGADERNFIDDLISQQVNSLNEQIEKARDHIKVADRAFELLEEFEYQPELIVPQSFGNGIWFIPSSS